MRLSFRPNSLTVRLTGALLLIISTVLALLTALQLSLQSRYASQCARLHAVALSESLYGALHTSMLANDRQGLQQSVQQIAQRAPNVRVRIFNKEGMIVFSSNREEVGTALDPAAEACYRCHQAGRPLERLPTGEQTREFTLGDEKAVGAIRPIDNEPACSEAPCHAHPKEKQLLGVLDVTLVLTSARARQQQVVVLMLLSTGLLLALVAGAVTQVVHKNVHQPIRALGSTLQALGEGDFSVRYETHNIAEFAYLGQALNRTAQQLERANAELLQWAHTLERRVEEKTAELRTAQEQMLRVERMASLGRLAAVVAHEINNPLASVVTYSKLLLRRLEKNPEQLVRDPEARTILQAVSGEAARCGEIVANLLLFARRTTARFEPSQLNELVEKSLFLLRHKMDLSRVQLQLDLDPQVGVVVCDPAQVQQVVLAVCMNAIEAMPQGGKLTVRTESRGSQVALVVEDEGVGMTEEVQKHIFEPFFTTKSENHAKSLGLGLAVAYGIVQRHRGDIQVKSEPGGGSTFTVVLPRSQSGEGGEIS